jgi:hypothetical protein
MRTCMQTKHKDKAKMCAYRSDLWLQIWIFGGTIGQGALAWR